MSPTTQRPGHLLRTACLFVAAALAAVLVPWEPATAQATEVGSPRTQVVVHSEVIAPREPIAPSKVAAHGSAHPGSSTGSSVAAAPSAPAAGEIATAQAATEQSVPRAAIVTIAVLSALIIVLLIAFVVWMRRRGHAEADEDAAAGDGGDAP